MCLLSQYVDTLACDTATKQDGERGAGGPPGGARAVAPVVAVFTDVLLAVVLMVGLVAVVLVVRGNVENCG